MNKAQEVISVIEALKAQTAFKGDTDFSNSEVKDMIANIDKYKDTDNLPKWLGVAISAETKIPMVASKHIVLKILKDILKGKIKRVDFKRDSKKHIVGLSNININSYV